MRAFLAVEPSGSAHTELVKLLDTLQEQKDWLRPVKPEQLHLTLRFFAQLSEQGAESIRIALSEVDLTGFTTNLTEIGCFPNWKRPRVVWVGCSESGWQSLHTTVDDTLVSLDLERDRRFHPHITLGRVKKDASPGQMESVKQLNVPDETFAVNKLLLKKSVLTPKGAVYSTAWELSLGETQDI